MSPASSLVVLVFGATVGLAAAAADGRTEPLMQTRVDPAGDVQTMLWSRGPSTRFGVGVGVTPQWDGSADRSLRLGLAVSTLAPSRLVWQIGTSDEAPVRNASPMTFAKASSSARLGLRSTLRYDIDSRTTITVKPRRSRISITYAHQW